MSRVHIKRGELDSGGFINFPRSLKLPVIVAGGNDVMRDPGAAEYSWTLQSWRIYKYIGRRGRKSQPLPTYLP